MHKSIKNIGFVLFTVLVIIGILMLASLDSNKDNIKDEKSYYKSRNIAYGLVVIGVIGFILFYYTFNSKRKQFYYDDTTLDTTLDTY